MVLDRNALLSHFSSGTHNRNGHPFRQGNTPSISAVARILQFWGGYDVCARRIDGVFQVRSLCMEWYSGFLDTGIILFALVYDYGQTNTTVI